jgi:hypothetical protein
MQSKLVMGLLEEPLAAGIKVVVSCIADRTGTS